MTHNQHFIKVDLSFYDYLLTKFYLKKLPMIAVYSRMIVTYPT